MLALQILDSRESFTLSLECLYGWGMHDRGVQTLLFNTAMYATTKISFIMQTCSEYTGKRKSDPSGRVAATGVQSATELILEYCHTSDVPGTTSTSLCNYNLIQSPCPFWPVRFSESKF